MSDQQTITIDGREIPFTEGQTIMDAALAAKVYVPHLCHNPEFVPHGNCRLCVVKVNGRFQSACTTPAASGQNIDNSSEEIMDMRRTLLQMLFVEGNHVCPACEKSGRCQLQALGYYTGMLNPHFTHFFPLRRIDASHPDVVLDFNRCILCELCVRASRDVDKKNVFGVTGRGINAKIIVNASSGKLGDTDFSVDDKAFHVCPVGAILPKHKGFEVPIGERLYDQQDISIVGDVAAHDEENAHA